MRLRVAATWSTVSTARTVRTSEAKWPRKGATFRGRYCPSQKDQQMDNSNGCGLDPLEFLLGQREGNFAEVLAFAARRAASAVSHDHGPDSSCPTQRCPGTFGPKTQPVTAS